MKPYVVCHMMISIDGRILTDRWSRSPDGTRDEWEAAYSRAHETLDVDGWLVGRVTMAEMAKGEPHPPSDVDRPERPIHDASRGADSFAIALDRSAKLHFAKSEIQGDHVVVLLGHDVADAHLAELAADGISYVVAESDAFDLVALLGVVADRFGVKRLALEGGAGVNASFVAAGLVDEISLLVVPTLDGSGDSRSLFEGGEGGLADKAQLSFLGSETLEAGLVHLRYKVDAQG